MTDTTDQQAVTVAQEDREAAALLVPLCFGASKQWQENVRAGFYDDGEIVQAFARHRLASVSSASADWTRTKTFDEAAAECMRAADASTFAETVSEDERNGHRSACNLLAMNFRVMASRAAPEWLAPEPVPATNQAGEVAELRQVLRHIAEGNLGDAPWQCNYSLIKEVAAASIATQPATSQEGEAAKYADMDTDDRATAMADDCVGDPWELLGFFREKLRQSEANAESARAAAIGFAQRLAATPTPPTATPQEGGLYLIRKRGMYYRPNAEGYTCEKARAGRFTLEQAISHSHPNGLDGPRDGIDYMADDAPTPPTLSEDLRECLAGARDIMGRSADIVESWGRRDESERLRRGADICRAALAQVKAS